jgi:hypothetical protein
MVRPSRKSTLRSRGSDQIVTPVDAGGAHRSWRDVIKVHPACGFFPPMSPDELRELGKDIRAYGLKSPIALYCKDNPSDAASWSMIDGCNRLDAMELEGIPFELAFRKLSRRPIYRWFLISDDNDIIFPDEPIVRADADPYAYVISANIHRRHLRPAEKRDLIAKLIKAQPEKSNRQIAKTAKVDDKTVGAVRSELEASAEIPQLEKTIGADGKARKRKPRHEIDGKSKTTLDAEMAALDTEASAEARKAEHTALDADQIKQPPRAEVSKLVRAWVQASPEAKREFVRERWDEIVRARKRLDANGTPHEDRWIEGDTL